MIKRTLVLLMIVMSFYSTHYGKPDTLSIPLKIYSGMSDKQEIQSILTKQRFGNITFFLEPYWINPNRYTIQSKQRKITQMETRDHKNMLNHVWRLAFILSSFICIGFGLALGRLGIKKRKADKKKGLEFIKMQKQIHKSAIDEITGMPKDIQNLYRIALDLANTKYLEVYRNSSVASITEDDWDILDAERHEELISLGKSAEKLFEALKHVKWEFIAIKPPSASLSEFFSKLPDLVKMNIKKCSELKEKEKILEAELQNYKKRFSEMKLAAELSDYFFQGQRNFLDERNEPEAAAVISFLSCFSLFGLLKAMLTQEDKRKKAMLHNLILISSRLKNTRGFEKALDNTKEKLSQLNQNESELSTTNDKHVDDRIFQIFLKYLRDIHRLDFTPFYFDVDSHGMVHRAN